MRPPATTGIENRRQLWTARSQTELGSYGLPVLLRKSAAVAKPDELPGGVGRP
ncbi:MAG TPA: hypothetical protein VJ813_06840 [Vicinamibacterales bacterium]|nr:hypothetical protein [Vicinamibacterales bacterium]